MLKHSHCHQKDIRGAIVEAIAFFDMFDLPLAPFEIWQSLRLKISYGEVLDILEEDRPKAIDRRAPFYFLKGRKDMAEKARRQFHLSQRKAGIARKAANILKFVNGVKMVAVCNNFYYQEESDIDVFIIIKKNRMWTARSFSTLLLSLSGLRRHGRKIKDRICLSFYVTEGNSGLEEISLPGGDPYLDFWTKHLTQIYDKGAYTSFLRENNWIKKRFPNIVKRSPVDRTLVFDDIFSRLVKGFNGLWFDGFIGDAFERAVRKVQLKKMSGNNDSLAKEPDSRVIISDAVLKFHENDRRGELKDRLRRKKEELMNLKP